MLSKKSSDSGKLDRAGKLLHDDIGPLLSAAGLKLQLIAMDFPDAAPLVRDVTATLDLAIDRVRALSREMHIPNLRAAVARPAKASKSKTKRPGKSR
jgi:signal transduction histidine kinase